MKGLILLAIMLLIANAQVPDDENVDVDSMTEA